MAFTRALVVCSFLVLVSPFAHASGRIQLALTGEIAPAGGARIEIDLAFRCLSDGRADSVHLDLHLAQKTTAAEVAALVEYEILRAGGGVLRTLDPRNATSANLFVENATAVGLRLGRGLSAQVCACEEGPTVVRFLAPKEVKESARFTLSASSEHPHTFERARHELAIDLTPATSGEQAADLLTTASIGKGWTAQWLNHSAWGVQTLPTGARATGACLTLDTNGDWRLEVEFTAAARAR